MKNNTRSFFVKQAVFATLVTAAVIGAAPRAYANDWTLDASFNSSEEHFAIGYNFSNFESSMDYRSNDFEKKIFGIIKYSANGKSKFSVEYGHDFLKKDNILTASADFKVTDDLAFSVISKYTNNYVNGAIATTYTAGRTSITLKAGISNNSGKYEPSITLEIGKIPIK